MNIARLIRPGAATLLLLILAAVQMSGCVGAPSALRARRDYDKDDYDKGADKMTDDAVRKLLGEINMEPKEFIKYDSSPDCKDHKVFEGYVGKRVNEFMSEYSTTLSRIFEAVRRIYNVGGDKD